MADETQSIQSFFKVAQERDFARDFQFRVFAINNRGKSIVTQEDLVFAQTAILPARTIANQPVPFMGLSFNVPGAAQYDGSPSYAIQFRADGEHVLRTLFEDWSREVFEDKTSGGAYRMFADSIIELHLMNQSNEKQLGYKLIGVYPVTVGELSYDRAGTGAPITFTATVAYQYWERDTVGGAQVG